jgi:thioredoxin-related protein
MNKMIIVGIALCLVTAFGCGGTGAGKDAPKGSAAIDAKMWVGFNEGMAAAAKDKKHVVIDFYTSWCHWCKVMDKETFQDPDVKKFLAENFITIRVNAESVKDTLDYKGKKYTPVQLARAFGVRGYPALAYLDREGELVTVVPGFVPAKTFLPLLDYMNKECYRQQMTFEEFMKRNGDCNAAATK